VDAPLEFTAVTTSRSSYKVSILVLVDAPLELKKKYRKLAI